MKTLSLILVALLSPSAFGQSVIELSVEITNVEVEESVERQKIVKQTFEGREFVEPVETVVESVRKIKAKRAKFAGDQVRGVQVFNSDFETFPVRALDVGDFLIVAKPGRYLLVADTDKGSRIQPFVIEGSKPDDPEEPEDPKPDDPIEFGEVEKLSADLADKLNDLPTRSALSKALGAITFTTFDESVKTVNKAIEDVFLARGREGSKADWLDGWRRPLDKALQGLNLTTVEQYKGAIGALKKGLDRQPTSAPATVSNTPLPAPAPRFELRPFEVCEGGRCRIVYRYVQVQ